MTLDLERMAEALYRRDRRNQERPDDDWLRVSHELRQTYVDEVRRFLAVGMGGPAT